MSFIRIDSSEGVNKKSENAMKNKTWIILTFLAVLGTASNSFADRKIFGPTYPYSGAGRTHTDVVPMGMTSYSKEGGVQTQTISSLHPGNMVTVKLRSGSPIAESVEVGN